MKKRIAIWTYGGIGVGLFSQGYPMMVKLVEGLSQRHHITIYSYVSIDPDFVPKGYQLYAPPQGLMRLLRWPYLFSIFGYQHARTSYHAMFGFWAYPTGFVTTVLSKFFRLPVIINTLGAELTDVPEINYGLLRKGMPRKLILWTLRKATVVMTISRYQSEIIKSLGIGRSVSVVPWGADSSLFPFKRKNWDELRILHVANLNAVKNQEMLIRAFAEIRKEKPARLKIVGADFFHGKIQHLVKELSLEKDVEFVGAVSYESISSYYEWANIMMHTSFHEGQCMALTEAAASGLLLAGTRVGILFDLGDDCAIAVQSKEYERLAKEILSLGAQHEKYEQKIVNAKKWSDEHDFNWTIDQFDKIIKEVNFK